jgi:hypothetical protein
VATTFDAGSTNTLSGVIVSDQPILMAHLSGTNRDAYSVPPVATELVGIRSNNVAIGALEDATNLTVYTTDGTSQTYTLDKGGRLRINIGTSGTEGRGDAYHIVSDKPIAAIQVADSDGSEATAFWPPQYFATRYALPVDTQYVAVTCLESAVDITLNDGVNPPQTQTCSSDGITPGKVYFGSNADGANIAAGATFESTAPIYAIFEVSARNDEHNLLGNLKELEVSQ